MISGLRAVKTALENEQARFLECIVTEDKINLLDQVFKNSHHIIPQFSTSEKDFSRLVDEKTPQGICLVAQKPATSFTLDKFLGNKILYLDRINDPGNLGTIIRSAEWFGFNTILLSPESADPYQPKVVRSSAGIILNISIVENVTINQIQQLKNEMNFKVYGTEIIEGRNITNFQFAKKLIIMMGSEAHGLDSELLKICDDKISIDRIGKGESLNLANAAAIIMYQTTMNNNQ